MRVPWRDLVVDVAHYDILRISGDLDLADPFPDFRDVHQTDSPIWRLASGYLMLAEDGPNGSAQTLVVHSHGRPVARLEVGDDNVILRNAGGWSFSSDIARGGGLAVGLERGRWESLAADTVAVKRSDPWSVTIVHGPSEAKVQNRLRLLASLQSLGVPSG